MVNRSYDVTDNWFLCHANAVDYRQESQTFTVIAKSGRGQMLMKKWQTKVMLV